MHEQQQVDGTVERALPRGLFRIRCDDGHHVTASFGARARRITVKLLPGDRVRVEISRFDPTRGRIMGRIG